MSKKKKKTVNTHFGPWRLKQHHDNAKNIMWPEMLIN